jgi:hypothetical protein
MIPVEILDVSVPLESTNSVVADDANEFQASNDGQKITSKILKTQSYVTLLLCKHQGLT